MTEPSTSKVDMEKIVSLCRRRGFIFPSSEIYGGLSSCWDYGPLGVELKRNIKDAWWRAVIQERDDMVGLDSSILMHPQVWAASGHLEGFSDPLVECKNCHLRYRADELESNNCPSCSGELTEPRMFHLMFKTFMGPVEEEAGIVYLRPETAQGMFVNFQNVLNTTRKRLPFGIAQIGKAFRNEIIAGNFIFRLREFEQMEIEYFISPDTKWEPMFDEWLKRQEEFALSLGANKKDLRHYEHPDDKRSHYSQKTIDIEYKFPFGFKELYGMAYRSDYDLTSHSKASGEKLEYFDQESGKRYTPHVLEPTFGLDRSLLVALVAAYHEEKVKGETRVVMKFPKEIAPIQVAILPLSKKEELSSVARGIFDDLKTDLVCEYDETQSIGKRYRRQDEIGTPYCVTVDFDSLEDKAVTVRDRDSMEQERVKIAELREYLQTKFK